MSRGSNYDKHVKVEAVSLVIDSGKSIASVSRELDIAKSTVGNWVRDYKDDGTESFVGSGNLIEHLTILFPFLTAGFYEN